MTRASREWSLSVRVIHLNHKIGSNWWRIGKFNKFNKKSSNIFWSASPLIRCGGSLMRCSCTADWGWPPEVSDKSAQGFFGKILLCLSTQFLWNSYCRGQRNDHHRRQRIRQVISTFNAINLSHVYEFYSSLLLFPNKTLLRRVLTLTVTGLGPTCGSPGYAGPLST